MPLTTLIKAIQDIMRKDVGVDGDAQRISQMVWLIFLKVFDDKEQEWQLTVPGYTSPLPSRFRWSSWAKNPEGMTGEELIDFVNNDFFPACGTGGFLTCAIEHLSRQVRNADDRKRMQECIHGVEKKPLPHMLAMTNMMLHGIDVPTNVRHDNTLSRPLKDYGPRDRVDLIITNPPFGGMEEDGIENNFPRKYQTRETADLFMALIMHLLKHPSQNGDRGKAAVVLPDDFLFGEGTKTNLKRELLEEFNLHTIVRLPKGVFSPYTSIATNILFFEKGGPTEEVWFFTHPYPESYKSYSRSKPLTIAEFDLEKGWWGGAERTGRKTTEHAWKVSAGELAERNYNLDCKNPHEVEVNHRDPQELMAEYKGIVKQLEAAQQALKSELMACLGGKA